MTQKHPPFQNNHTSQQFISSKPPTLQILLIQEKIVPQDLNLDPLRFGEQLKQKVCFGRNRIQNQKRFFHFGKTEIRPNTESVSVVHYHFVWLFWKKFSKTLGTECPLFNTKFYYLEVLILDDQGHKVLGGQDNFFTEIFRLSLISVR